MTKFWKWTDQSPTTEPDADRTLELYGTIAEESWFGDEITPEMFREELRKGTGKVTIWINSPGGDCVAASQIYSMLMDYPGEVTVKIDGLAASAASVIAMAGTKVLMAPTAMMMIHNPATFVGGDHKDFEQAIKVLAEVKESIINAYEIKTGRSRVELSHLMDAETWMNAKKAIEMGFADAMLEDEKKVAEDTAFSFSEKTINTNLMSRITAKLSKEVPQGRRVDDLYERLQLIGEAL